MAVIGWMVPRQPKIRNGSGRDGRLGWKAAPKLVGLMPTDGG